MQKERVKRPPGPSWLHLMNMFSEDTTYCNIDYPLKLTEQYGDIIYSKLFKIYLLTGPKAFEHVLKINPKNYIRQKFVYNHMRFFFGNSLLVTEGTAWKHRRKMALPAYQHQRLQSYIPTITRIAEQQTIAWEVEKPEVIDLFAELNRLNLSISLNLFCQGTLPKKTLDFLSKALGFCNQYCSSSPWIHPLKPTPDNARFFYLIYQIDRILLEIIRTRRKSRQSIPDLLGFLLDATNQETQKPLTDKEILAEFKTHIITSHETTACSLSWMWYLLAQNPDYLEPLEAELETVLNGEPPTESHIPHLPFTKAIISETFRLYPAVLSLARNNLEADTIEGYDIPKHSHLALHLYSLHRNPRYWDNPMVFYPERFLDLEAKRHPFQFLPFSAGPHTCMASHLAQLEMTLLTAVIARRFRFELLEKSPVIPDPCISLRPSGGVKMRPIRIGKD
jgi:cytochrome P450